MVGMDCKEEIIRQIQCVQDLLSSTLLNLAKLPVMDFSEWEQGIMKESNKEIQPDIRISKITASVLRNTSSKESRSDGSEVQNLKKNPLTIAQILEQTRIEGAKPTSQTKDSTNPSEAQDAGNERNEMAKAVGPSLGSSAKVIPFQPDLSDQKKEREQETPTPPQQLPMSEPKTQEGPQLSFRQRQFFSARSSGSDYDAGNYESSMVNQHPVGLDNLFQTGHFDREVFKAMSKEFEESIFYKPRTRLNTEPTKFSTPTNLLNHRKRKKIKDNPHSFAKSSTKNLLPITIRRVATEYHLDMQESKLTEKIPKGGKALLPKLPTRRKLKVSAATNSAQSKGKMEVKGLGEKKESPTARLKTFTLKIDSGVEAKHSNQTPPASDMEKGTTPNHSVKAKNAKVDHNATVLPKQEQSGFGFQILKGKLLGHNKQRTQLLYQKSSSSMEDGNESSRPFFNLAKKSLNKGSAQLHPETDIPTSECKRKPSDGESSTKISLLKRSSISQQLNEVSKGMQLLSKINRNEQHSSKIISQKSASFWMWLGIYITAVTITAICIPISLASDYNNLVDFQLERIIEVIFLFDIFVTSRTAYIDEWTKEEVFDARKIAHRYFGSSQFYLDVAGSMPICLFYGYQPNSPFPFIARLMKLMRVTRLAKMMKNVETRMDKLNPAVLRMAHVFLVFVLLLHLVTCTYWYLGRMGHLSIKNWVVESSMEIFETYGKALHFSISVLAGNTIGAEQWQEHYFVAFCLMLSIIINATVIGNATTIVSNMDSIVVEKKKQIDCIMEYMKKSKIPMNLQKRIRGYYDYLWDIGQASYSTKMLRDLPSKLAMELNITLKKHLLDTCPLMKLMTPRAILTMLQSVSSRVVLPKELVVRQGERAMAMYFIARGSVSVWAHDDKKSQHLEVYLTTLMEGAIFGEGGLLKSEGKNFRRNATVIAETFCELLMLQKQQFRSLVKSCPSFLMALQRVKADRVESTKNAMRNVSPGMKQPSFPCAPASRKTSLSGLNLDEILHRKSATAYRRKHRSSISSIGSSNTSTRVSYSGVSDSTDLNEDDARSRSRSKVKGAVHAARIANKLKKKVRRPSFHKTFPVLKHVTQTYGKSKSVEYSRNSHRSLSSRQSSLYEDIVQHHQDLVSHSMADGMLQPDAMMSPFSAAVPESDVFSPSNGSSNPSVNEKGL